MLLTVILLEIIKNRSQLSTQNTHKKKNILFPNNPYVKLSLLYRFAVMLCILCRSLKKTSEDHNTLIVQQSENITKMSSSIIQRNNRELDTAANWNDHVTIPPLNDGAKNTSLDINVEKILNTNITHNKKRGARIQDSLPGIKNKFG